MNVNSYNSVGKQALATNKQSEPQNGLGKDAFLQILVTQMKNQNPLEPLKDTEFIGQMTQFSSLEQLTNLNQTMNQLVGVQGMQSFTEHSNLIGKKVFWEYEVNGKLESGEGIVKALSFSKGELIVELEKDNIKVPIYAINRIEKHLETKNEQEIV
ncbi:flagellar hook capping FlgD N-terminal domain-containing protein [Paenisporosarcina sp. OV554]|uniref:flagellar hook capping FlgD N-terminal domain-containing protein n=1 Tax=Paenisporosarcina sp. OV554 TaxID=2135694 RepID=UPI000D39E0D6|nr:flagellar hook capping FlgD N-terminal domain-containing protein [Paenisporosarcina sp. OV554]PUB14666.1 flagellar basal-body rod modification protein FlgD [Paenisporosarcina sp. OV554]